MLQQLLVDHFACIGNQFTILGLSNTLRYHFDWLGY